MFARHSARRRSADSRISAERRTAGSFDAASFGCGQRPRSVTSHPECRGWSDWLDGCMTSTIPLCVPFQIIEQDTCLYTPFRRARKADGCIVQKDESDILLTRALLLAPTHDAEIALLPDC